MAKENVCSVSGRGHEKDFDAIDNSWTRSRALFLRLFRKAGLKVVGEKKQGSFPKGLYQVRLFALQ